MRKNAIIETMNQENVLRSKETTFTEYTDDLLRLQDLIVPIVMGNDYIPGMRVDEAIFRMESKARERGISSDPTVREGIRALKTVNREINICMAGRKGEDLVAKTLEFVDRPDARVFRNVYLSDGKEETELDSVVLTDSGVILLEIKKSKDNLTITEEGRLVHSGAECYEKRSLGKKMGIKRKLLKERLDLECARRGFTTPVRVDSYIVFVAPKGVRIKVNDFYHSEKWCHRTSLNRIIESYSTDSYYRDEQIDALEEIIKGIQQNSKSFTIGVDFEAIVDDFTAAMEILADQEEVIEKTWKEKIVAFGNSPAGKIAKTVAPFIIADLAGPAAGVIGRAYPKAAPIAAKAAKGIKIWISRGPVA